MDFITSVAERLELREVEGGVRHMPWGPGGSELIAGGEASAFEDPMGNRGDDQG